MSSEVEILRSLPCVHCGYDLAGLALDAPCPECGRPARDSLAGLALVDSSVLRSLRRGAWMMGWGSLGLPIVYGVGTALAYLMYWGPWYIRSERYFQYGLTGLVALCPVVCGLGWWRALRAIPGGEGVLAGSGAAARARVMGRVLTAVISAGMLAFIVLTLAWPRVRWGSEMVQIFTVAGGAAVWCWRNVAGLRGVQQIGRRGGARRLVLITRVWRVVNVACVPALVVVMGAVLMQDRMRMIERSRFGETAMMVFAGGTALAMAGATLGNVITGFTLAGVVGRVLRKQGAASGPLLGGGA